jgi:hypothetical protein
LSCLVVAAACAGAAAAANLTDLRVGVHGDHTRVVLETDGQAPYIVDVNDREVIVHVDAAAAAEAVTAKSPHLIWAKVEPTPIGADVRLSLKQPVDVKWLVLTGPHRIVLDLYPKKGAPEPLPGSEPLPAPELLPEPEPPVTADAEPGLPEEPSEPDAEELANADAEDEVELEPEPDGAAEDGLEPETPDEEAKGIPPTPEPEELATGPEAEKVIRVPLPTPGKRVQPVPEPPSGGLFGSPYLLGAAAVALAGVFLFMRRRLRKTEPEKYTYPEEDEEEEAPLPYEPPQRAVPVDAPAGVGESLFDVEPDVIHAIPKDEERPLRPLPADADSGDEAERRMATERLKSWSMRVNARPGRGADRRAARAARRDVARSACCARSAPRGDEEASEPVVRG